MPVITPAYPQMCATFNITHSTMSIIQRELERGFELTDKIRAGKLVWKDLFVKHTFFTTDHKYYLAVISTSTTKEAHKIWSGFIESKVRVLVGDLERLPSIAIARPFNKGYERMHRIKNDEECQEVQNGSLAHLIQGDEDEDDFAVKTDDGVEVKTEVKTEASSGTNVDNDESTSFDIKSDPENPKVEIDNIPDVPSNGTKVYTTTHYVGLELAEGKCPPSPHLSSPFYFYFVYLSLAVFIQLRTPAKT